MDEQLDPRAHALVRRVRAQHRPSPQAKRRNLRAIQRSIGSGSGPRFQQERVGQRGEGRGTMRTAVWLLAAAAVVLAVLWPSLRSFVGSQLQPSARPSQAPRTEQPAVETRVAPQRRTQPAAEPTALQSADTSRTAPAPVRAPVVSKTRHEQPAAEAPDDELVDLQGLKAAFDEGAHANVLERVADYRRRWTKPRFDEEVDAIEAMASCALGRPDGARLAQRFVSRHAASLHVRRVREQCLTPPVLRPSDD